MTTQETRRLQSRILLLALVSLLITGLVAAGVTAYAYYDQARERAELGQQSNLRYHTQAVAQYFSRLEDVGWQVTSRSQIRDALAAWNAGDWSLEELRAFTDDKLEDALGPSGAVGIIRLDAEREPVIRVGAVTPEPSLWPPVEADMREQRLSTPLEWQGGIHLLLAVPIIDRDGDWLGADILVFPAEPLATMLSAVGEKGAAAHLMGPSGAILYGNADDWGVAQQVSAPLQRALERAVMGESTTRRHRDEVIFAAPSLPGWGMATALPPGELYAGVAVQMGLPVGLVLAMAVLGGVAMVWVMRPLSAQVIAQSAALERAASEQEDLLEYARGFVYRFNAGGEAGYISPGVHPVLGYPPSRVPDTTVQTLMAPFLPYLDGTAVPIHGELEAELPPARMEVLDHGGRRVVLELNARIQYDDQGVQHIFGVARDITDREEAERRVSHLAHFDALTDLPNRALLDDRLDLAIQRSRRQGRKLAVMFVDLDGFKYVNDSLGHHRGDELLAGVAERLRDAMRAQDTIARHGGDEFVILAEGVEDTTTAEQVAAKLLAALAAPFLIGGQELFIGASVGISLYPDDAEVADSLIRNADSAMYRAKARGRNNIQFYTTDLTAASQRRLTLEAGLRRAVEGDELEVVYQPQWSLPERGLIGAEALVRWHHPEFGLISPAEFIPVAEENGTINLLGGWVLRRAVAQAVAWGPERLPRIAVNLSGYQILYSDIVSTVREVLEQSGLAPERLELEITEGFVMDHAERGIAVLEELRAMGVQLAIDDFGTGYSSFSYLKRLPVQRLKIDGSFVRGADSDPADAALTASIIAMAHKLDLEVVAEGVETEAQLSLLVGEGCNEAQGFLLARPTAAGNFPQYFTGG